MNRITKTQERLLKMVENQPCQLYCDGGYNVFPSIKALEKHGLIEGVGTGRYVSFSLTTKGKQLLSSSYRVIVNGRMMSLKG